MKKMKIISLMCAGIIALGTFFQSGIEANAATTNITLETENYEINNGDELSVRVYLQSDSNIGAYHTEVVYDSYRLEYISGGDSENNGKVILEGTGYGGSIVYKLKFKAISGGKAEISCSGADIRVEGTEGGGKQDVSYGGSLRLDISGKDTGVFEKNLNEYGIETDIPLCGIVDLAGGKRYYIVDHSRFVPDEVDWKWETIQDVYETAKYTFLTNAARDIRLIYMMDSDEKFVLYAYSNTKKAFYPCKTVESDGKKYYVMSANACDNWAEELTLDYVKRENICYVMNTEGVCGFYKYDDGNLERWTEGEGQAYLDEQMELFYEILVGAVTFTIAIVLGIVISNHRKQTKKRKKEEEEHKASKSEDFSIEFINVNEEAPRADKLVVDGEARNDKAKEATKRWPRKDKPVIAIKDVTMKFRISTGNASGLKEYIIQKLKRQVKYREFTALNHVSINIYKGEVVGIIGTNGSGKSTLLKIVSGGMIPTGGKVSVDRKKVQLLTLGTGFDKELTARENIYLSGAIIGYSKSFIDENFDRIIEFAELQDFVDEKVKNFSSGMVSRLGFSIATIGEAAEILILDEILSVGDEFFKKKSLKRIHEMMHSGATVIMVSHGMNTILENCTKVVWLEKGKVKMIGEPKIVCKEYKKFSR